MVQLKQVANIGKQGLYMKEWGKIKNEKERFFVMIFVVLICSVCFADGYTYEDFQNGHIPARWV